LVIKLNEVTFKPLFIRLYDWAVIDLSEGASEYDVPDSGDSADGLGPDNARLVERKIVLLHVMMGLLQKFRVSSWLLTVRQALTDPAPALAIHWHPASSHRRAATRIRQWLDSG
jgi:hypothetical protein